MAALKGGYFVCHTDADAAGRLYREALEFLETENLEPIDPTGWSLVFETRAGSPVMRVTLVEPPDMEGSVGPVVWHEQNPGLAALFAQALDCDVYAFGFDPRTDSEYVEWFDPEGSVEEWRTSGEQDDDPEDSLPMTRLASTLEVSRDFLLKSLHRGPCVVQPLDAPLDEERLRNYFATVAPMPRPPPAEDAPNAEVHLPQSVVDEARTLAVQQGTTLSTVLCQRFQRGFPRLREGLRTDPGALASLVAGPAKDERVKCELYIPVALQKQMRELVELSDRPVSWLLGAAFRLGQAA